MARWRRYVLAAAAVALACVRGQAQSPRQIVQQVVDSERAADRLDHSNWIYLDKLHTPKGDLLQWVAMTQQGNIDRVLAKDDRPQPESTQREQIQSFLNDPRARNKQLAENSHDNRQIDDLLKLLPQAFLWTQTGATSLTTTYHFEPDPAFHPPTREARVFGGMAGDLTFDNRDRRICAMQGHLTRDVTFGGGLLGKLREGSSFSLVQANVGSSLWELTAIHVHLQGTALLFKSISLEQDDDRSRFVQEPQSLTLNQAAAAAMAQPELPVQTSSR